MAGAISARTLACAALVTATLSVASACSDSTSSGPGARTRTYVMGFSNFPPAPDVVLAQRAVQMWTSRADAAILHLDVPWPDLLAGARADSLVRANVMPVVRAYANAGLSYVIETDVTNGVDRAAEAPTLVSLGRSITEDTVQKLYATYIAALDTVARPTYLGLASETNLIRLVGPPGVYDAIVKMTNAAAASHSPATGAGALYVSVQADVAWGRLGGSGAFVGIDRDRADFPFITALGLSAYPYLAGYTNPSQVPDDYFARLRGTPALDVLITKADGPRRTLGRFTLHRRCRRHGSGVRPISRRMRERLAGFSSRSPTSICQRSDFRQTIRSSCRSSRSAWSTLRWLRSRRWPCGIRCLRVRVSCS
jgi:hypothetical protein